LESEGLNYPRKQMRRENWQSLNGQWKFAFDNERKMNRPNDVTNWPHFIQVPYCPESKASGLHDGGFHQRCWYERAVTLKKSTNKVLLHFGAVDYKAQVWVNSHYVGSHEGGHVSFSFDITPYLEDGEEQIITVCADDDPHDLAKPRGKQDWQLEPHGIWYHRTTGIWQSVWLEEVPQVYIEKIRWQPFLERWEIGCEAYINGNCDPGLQIRVKLCVENEKDGGVKLLANDTYEVINQEIHRRIALSDPGIDDYRNELLWSPEKPTLIDATVELVKDGVVIDKVVSYTALRDVAVSRDRFLLNSRPYYMRLVLDQGYWPDTLMTAPSPEALRKDIELVKAAGFNGVRKHQKIEDPDFLYWADVLGLLVWVEMPSAYRFTHESVERLMKEWVEIIDRDSNHPSVVVWVPFNESWGVPDLAAKQAHRNCVQAMYHLTKTLDPTRPVVGNDGWESTATDLLGIHDYDDSPERLIKKYATEKTLEEALTRYRPGGRMLTLEGYPHHGQPVMLTEFGGIACNLVPHPKQWGYSLSESPEEFRKRYEILMAAIHRIEIFAGFCYTQFTDTFQEANGLFTMDRKPKFSINMMAYATRGAGYTRGELNTLPQPPPLPKREELYEQSGSV
jgi:beta-galactosidase/beta-glucuronidase